MRSILFRMPGIFLHWSPFAVRTVFTANASCSVYFFLAISTSWQVEAADSFSRSSSDIRGPDSSSIIFDEADWPFI
ncbi:Hypothetical protein NTJ_08277 [Nesidiocoris tenuis]|uniref:Secreted protein n=1 Tax=Nesidiocoris tenuis TaxID=355587 RepID=A0ABN7AU47_9HEMI|nr:Hypothetical protein NTJ_08277 [Nesidiocoris tenuis]